MDDEIKFETCSLCGAEDYEGSFTLGMCDDCYEEYLGIEEH